MRNIVVTLFLVAVSSMSTELVGGPVCGDGICNTGEDCMNCFKDCGICSDCNAGAGGCCVGNGTPGCDDKDCCQCICQCDPFCCDTHWDDICAGQGVVGKCGAANPAGPCAEPCSECIIECMCAYGDITSTKGLCIPDCTCGPNDVNFDDILCALEGFLFPANCPCADIRGLPGPNECIGDGVIDFDDILTILNAFTGIYECPGPCS